MLIYLQIDFQLHGGNEYNWRVICSLNCKNAIEYGKGLHNDVKSFGYTKISETLINHAKTYLYRSN